MTSPSRRTIVVTGSASGMGEATASRLRSEGHDVIGVDLHDAEVIADLSTPLGRSEAIAEITRLAPGSIDGLVTWAGLAGLTGIPGSLLVSVNYFGCVALFEGLRELLARGNDPAAVAISSNSTTCQPSIPMQLVDLCLSGDEEAARRVGDEVASFGAYPTTKTAIARWVRRNAPSELWAGSGITLNAVAPGAVETPMLQATRADPTIGEFIDVFPIPVGRKGTADELAGFVCFLLGPDARFCCGSVFFVDGGTDALIRPDRTPTPM